VSMPLIFWTKMNDIRLALWLFSSAGRLRKTIHPSPSLARLTTPFFAPVFGRSKMWWSDASLDGVCPQNETRSLGFTCHRWGVSFRFGSPVFPSSLDAHQDKNKAYRPRFTRLVKCFLPQNKFVTFSDFASFYLSVCTLKTHSEARKTVLNFQRRFGCFIG
ncbi:hypothetical protein J4731_21470, partial [Providencia rettgeri]|nr:hypothetical protein [Providencia rettgeri]